MPTLSHRHLDFNRKAAALAAYNHPIYILMGFFKIWNTNSSQVLLGFIFFFFETWASESLC